LKLSTLATLVVVFGLASGCAPEPSVSGQDVAIGSDIVADTSDTTADTPALDSLSDGTADTTDTTPLDVGPDVGPDVSPDVVSPPDGETVPSQPPAVVQVGAGGFLLRGTVLTPSGPLDPGEVLFIGNTIVCVAANCSGHSLAGGVTIIDTHEIISPGLIDGHNHLTYNFLPEWVAPHLYDSRDVWVDEPSYEAHVAPFADGRNLNERVCPAAKWGELRSLIHGTTTVQGQSFQRSCLNRLVRNADHYHGLGYNHLGTSIASPADMNTNDGIKLAERFAKVDNPTTRYAIHMCEGLRGSNMAIEFDSWAGRDPRTQLARHQGLSLLAYDGTYTHPTTGAATSLFYRGVAVLIHSMILTEPQLQEVKATDSFVVWSPSSNLVLYGATAPIARMLELNLTIGIGPDWTPSGEDELLSEMRFAVRHGRTEGINALTYERIWRMATSDGAEVLGFGDALGSLEIDYRADIAVFGRTGADPYQAVIESRAKDVRLVFIDGLAYFGDLALMDDVALNDVCDVMDACGKDKFLCARETPGHEDRAEETVGDIEDQLRGILATYNRTNDLLPLIQCE